MSEELHVCDLPILTRPRSGPSPITRILAGFWKGRRERVSQPCGKEKSNMLFPLSMKLALTSLFGTRNLEDSHGYQATDYI